MFCLSTCITAFNFVCRCAFLHFCSVKRPKLKQENPSLSVGAMARQLSSAWKLMTPEQKKPYNEMAERDKQRSVELWTHILSPSLTTPFLSFPLFLYLLLLLNPSSFHPTIFMLVTWNILLSLHVCVCAVAHKWPEYVSKPEVTSGTMYWFTRRTRY